MIPESPFYLEGEGGLFEFVQQRLKENGHVVIVLAEGAGQEYVLESVNAAEEKDASGNKLLLDVGPWLTQKIKVMARDDLSCFQYLIIGTRGGKNKKLGRLGNGSKWKTHHI